MWECSFNLKENNVLFMLTFFNFLLAKDKQSLQVKVLLMFQKYSSCASF